VDVLDAIAARRSTGRLAEPAPTDAEVARLVEAAVAAPDHGTLRPWRFIVLRGDAKDAFGAVLADAYERRCLAAGTEVVPAKLEKERTKLGRAPLVVVVAAVPEEGKIPEVEQVAAVAAATQNLLLAATALGYGSMWRTGDPCYDDQVKAALGVRPDDHLVGFVYLGTATNPARVTEVERTTEGVLSTWQPA
jgi:nitroreductase